MMGDNQEAILLTTLAARWDTTANALRLHILRQHRKGTPDEVLIKFGRITIDGYERLKTTYLPQRE